MKKFIHYSVNLIIGISLIIMFSENSYALSKNVSSSNATQTNGIIVSKTNITFGPAASSDTFSITSSVSWVVTSNQSWLTVTPVTGINNGVLTVVVTANTGTVSRSGTITVSSAMAGSNITVSNTIQVTQAAQAPIPVSYLNVSRTNIILSSFNACTDTFAITFNVSWTITIANNAAGSSNTSSWLTVTPVLGSNNAVINLSATANTSSTEEVATVVVSSGTLSKTITVTQPAAPQPAPYLNVSRTNITLSSYNACTDTFAIISNVNWTITIAGISPAGGITTTPTWLTVTPTSGANNAVINLSATANTTSTNRVATVIVSSGTLSKTITVTQPAAPQPAPYLNVSRTNITLSSYNACTDTFAITSNVNWTVTIVGISATGNSTTIPTWLTATPVSGSNNLTVNLTATANTTNAIRAASVIVSSGNLSKTITVTQPATPSPYLNVSRTNITLSTYNACNDTFAITSNVNWTISVNGGTSSTTIPTWLTVTPVSGSNNLIVNLAATANTTNAVRTAYLIVSSGTLSKKIAVTQPAILVPTPYLNVSRTNIPLSSYNACTDTFTITSNVSWTITVNLGVSPASSNVPAWLTVSPVTGSNNHIINLAATANTTTATRTAYVIVTSGTLSKTISVTQPAAPPTPYLNVSRTSITLHSYNACTDTFAITSNVSWTVSVIANSAGNITTSPTWLTVTPISGSNNLIINIAATSNTSTASRTAYIEVSSASIAKIITVTQVGASTNVNPVLLGSHLNNSSE